MGKSQLRLPWFGRAGERKSRQLRERRGQGQSFVAVIVDVKQEKTHHQKSEENHVHAHLKRLQKARQRFLKPVDYQS